MMPDMQHDTDSLVLRVNELFHDCEGEAYENVHPEIFTRELQRWKNVLEKYAMPSVTERFFVDIGCGTGFVSMLIAERLSKNDSLLCTDISQEMLTVCSRKLLATHPHIRLSMYKVTNESLAIPSSSTDVITMNSVLHHIPDAEALLDECLRILKPGGLLFIGHEPNSRFFRNTFLRMQYVMLSRLKTLAGRRRGKRKKSDGAPDARLTKINETLLREGLIVSPLTPNELSALIDIHSPTAGGLHKERGFDAVHVLDRSKQWEIIELQTYNHLSKISGLFGFLARYEKLLTFLLPRHGSIFFLVARKKEETRVENSVQSWMKTVSTT